MSSSELFRFMKGNKDVPKASVPPFSGGRGSVPSYGAFLVHLGPSPQSLTLLLRLLGGCPQHGAQNSPL